MFKTLVGYDIPGDPSRMQFVSRFLPNEKVIEKKNSCIMTLPNSGVSHSDLLRLIKSLIIKMHFHIQNVHIQQLYNLYTRIIFALQGVLSILKYEIKFYRFLYFTLKKNYCTKKSIL